jgi:hypothetical protein
MPKRSLKLAGGAAALAAALLLSACGDKPGAAGTTPSAASQAPAASAARPTDASPSAGEESQRIADTFIQKASASAKADELYQELGKSVQAAGPAQDDQMLRAMDEYYSRYLPEVEKEFQAEKVQKELSTLKFPVTNEQIDAIAVPDVKELVKSSVDGGYKLDNAEGMVFPVIDYAKLAALAADATPAMKEYLALMALESDKRMAKDAALIISRDELSKRTLAAESFVKQYKDAPERDKVTARFVDYIQAYLLGMDNTPNFGQNFMIKPEIKAEMDKTASAYPDTVTGKMTKELLGLIDKNGGQMFAKDKDGNQAAIPEVQAFIDRISEEALKQLEG